MYIKKWIFIFFGFSFFILSCIGMINFIIDPLWTFAHINKFNNKQSSFNERQQKINKLYFEQKYYDSLLLGSSLTTYIDQNDFKDMKVYNLSAGNMLPSEYSSMIQVFKEVIKNQNIKNIIIGMDFFGVTKPTNDLIHKKGDFYLENSKEFLYRYKNLLSLDTLYYSIKNILNNFNIPNEYYTRGNVRKHKFVDVDTREKNCQINLKRKKVFFDNFIYNIEFFKVLKKLKEQNPHTNFIIFTTPVSAKYLEMVLSNSNIFNNYSKWLYDITSIFGKIYHFNDFNKITCNEENYFDCEHYYPRVGKIIAARILQNSTKIEIDFGKVLTKDNIQDYLISLNTELEEIKSNKRKK